MSPRLIPFTAALLLAACASTGPVRNDALFAQVKIGMTPEQVREVAGAPDEVMPFPLSHSNSWGWYYWESFGYYAMFSATFGPDGHVASTFVRRLNDGGDHGAK